MRKALVFCLMAGLLSLAGPAGASTGWARYDSDTWIKWKSHVSVPVTENTKDWSRYMLARHGAIGRARHKHKDWLASRVVVVRPQGSPPSSGDHWGTGAVQSMIRSIFGGDSARGLCTADRESGFDAHAYNPSGASGIFQLMPGWWDGTGQYGWRFDPFNAYLNIYYAHIMVIRRGWGDWLGGCI